MSPEQLAAAIRETDYLKRFDRRTYSKAFQEYTDRFAPTKPCQGVFYENREGANGRALPAVQRQHGKQLLYRFKIFGHFGGYRT